MASAARPLTRAPRPLSAPAPRRHRRGFRPPILLTAASTAAVAVVAASRRPHAIARAASAAAAAAAAAASPPAFSSSVVAAATPAGVVVPGVRLLSLLPPGGWDPYAARASFTATRIRPGFGVPGPPIRRPEWRRRRSSLSAAAVPARTDAESAMAADALSVVRAGIGAVDPRYAVSARLSSRIDGGGGLAVSDPPSSVERTYRLEDYDECLVVSFGKASGAMALAAHEAVSEALPGLPVRGVAVVKDGHATEEERACLEGGGVRVREASHPVPDARSASAASEILSLAKEATERTLVVICISGGGSALFCSPRPPLTLDDLAGANSMLLKSGMDIRGMNVIRKRLEVGKGGGLAMMAYPATCLTLVLSDIVGDPLDLIASGPTVPDPSTMDDARKLVKDYDMGGGGKFALPDAVLDLLEKGTEEGASSSHPVFSAERPGAGGSKLSETVLVGNNDRAVSACASEAEALGYRPVVLGTTIEGEARHVAGVYASLAERLCLQRASEVPHPIAELPAALIAGGETTVTLSDNNGRGGRNQELALAFALRFRDLRRSRGLTDVVLASVGTDGTDGPTDAAGAVVDGGTVDRIEEAAKKRGGRMSGDAALRDHDAYTFFDSTEDEEKDKGPLVWTGPTGTNVADVCVVLVR